MKKGEQAFTSYGARTNSFLLVHYGFCYQNNIYDSFEFYMKMNTKLESPDQIHLLIAPEEQEKNI